MYPQFLARIFPLYVCAAMLVSCGGRSQSASSASTPPPSGPPPRPVNVTFSQTIYGTGDPRGVITADFNADGKLDIATSNRDNTVSVLLNQGSGKFSQSRNYSVGGFLDSADGIVAGDFNRDGKQDLALSAYIPSGPGDVHVVLGNGDGTFASNIGLFPVSLRSAAIATGDFNGDHVPDLAVVNEFDVLLQVLLANRDGTFAPAVDYGPPNSQSRQSHVIAVGDFNNDSKPDIVTADETATGQVFAAVWLGNGDGTFQMTSDINLLQAYPYGVAVGDLNHDGKLDLVFVEPDAGANHAMGYWSVLLGNRDGSFQNEMVQQLGSAPQAVAVADLNGDGYPDLAIVDAFLRTLTVLFNDGTAQFPHTLTYMLGVYPNAVTAAPLRGQAPGFDDIVVANGTDNTISVFLNSAVP